MSHLSEGELHGWLDGAYSGSEEEASIRQHLESCSECFERLEEARGVRNEAAEILSRAIPESVAAPTFEEIARRAAEPAQGRTSQEAPGRRGRAPVRWLSVERLGWAATVVLALGAGWMGRALLVERGWTDPFHEGRPTVTSGAELQREQAASPEAGAVEEMDRAQPAERDSVSRSEFAAGGQLREDRDEVVEGAPPARERQAAALPAAPQAESKLLDEKAVNDLAPPAGAAPKSPTLGANEASSWHAMPDRALSAVPTDVVGCYRLEYSWSPAVGYLPGNLRLTDRSALERPGTEAMAITIPGAAVARLRQAIWVAPAVDSLWLQFVTDPEDDTLTVRLERNGADWFGEGRVRDPSRRAGEERGPMRLSSVPCETP